MNLLNEEEPRRAPLTFRTGQPVPRQAAKQASGVPAIVRPTQPRQSVDFITPKNIFAALEDRLERVSATPPKAQRKRPATASLGETFGPPVPPALLAMPPPPPPTPEELAARLARQQQELATQQARQLLAQYRFLGYLSEGGEHRAFLGKDRELYVVTVGEMMEGRLRVKDIDAVTVKLVDQKTNLEAILPLVKDGGKV
jgi:hypothetical protein